MDPTELARTIASRLAGELDLAATIEMKARETIEPTRPASSGGVTALEALRAMGGTLDGKISLHHTLGAGGMGVVHLATQATLGRHVAVKTLRAGVADVDATMRILREAWVTGALEHPNVVPVYDVGVDAQGSPVIVMKRIEGRHWGELIAQPDEVRANFAASDPLEWNVRILGSVCNAVHFAHSRGILHRDLKPENVMIGAFGEVYVLDWGIAVSLRDDPSGRLPPISQATDVAGTPSYMAPEMLLGDPAALSVRTDVYLLGAIFYEIFAGAPPHSGANLQALIASVLVSQPRFPSGFPAEAQRICRKAMDRDPAHRYESAEAFRFAVDEYLRHRGSRKLAWDAKHSLAHLLETLEGEAPSEERTLAVFNLLGECRFGYRAALSAWPENEAAQKGLDRALLAVIEHELGEGDPSAAAALLREMNAPSPEIAARVEAAVRARADEDERLRKLDVDLDPRVGTRTRTFIGGSLGVLWTLTPLAGWYHHAHGGTVTHAISISFSIAFLVIGGSLRFWARETMMKTALNRRLGLTVGLHLSLQIVLTVGASLAGLSPEQTQHFLILMWALTQALLAAWLEPWFGLSAAVSALSFLVVAARPAWLYPAMALDNAVLTYVLVRVWLPRQIVDQIVAQRRELRRQARRLLLAPRAARSEEELDLHRARRLVRLAADRRVERADRVHVALEISARGEDGAEAARLASVVEVAEHDRDVRALRDSIETGLPALGAAARALRRDDEIEPIVLREDVDRGADRVVARATIDRDAAELSHEGAERRAKEGVLADPRYLDAEHRGDGEGERQIPVRGVGRGDDDRLGDVRRAAVDRPAERSEPRLPEQVREPSSRWFGRHRLPRM